MNGKSTSSTKPKSSVIKDIQDKRNKAVESGKIVKK